MGIQQRFTADAATPRKMPVDLERRAACRFHTVMRVAKVSRENDVGLWRVRNISDEGMMLMTSIAVEPGEPLTISLSDKTGLEAKVVWWDGQRVGVEFDRTIDCGALLQCLVAEQKGPRYRPPRLPVALRAILYGEKGLHTVRLFNLSQHGAAFTHDGSFKVGMHTKLLFENGDEHRGVVRWARDGQAGMYLIEPFCWSSLESARRL